MNTAAICSSNDALDRMLNQFVANRAGDTTGVYSVCASHPLVLKAAMRQALSDQSVLLIESTANQVNQFGGYTGMIPADFPQFVFAIAEEIGLSCESIVLGGDHLGPLCWTNEPAVAAMNKACDLVSDYVQAGFLKIHLDASMKCADDDAPLSDAIVAERTVQMCKAAESAAAVSGRQSLPVYIIGTEVPVPGGETEGLGELEITPVDRASKTVETHRRAFRKAGLESAWERVIGLVVQPGVEFNHTDVHNYEAKKAAALSEAVLNIPRIVYEAHSTDYQPASAYGELVRDHFAILKVGPQLTFALREALFGLAAIENELIEESSRSNLLAVCESVMLAEPANWEKHYPRQEPQGRLFRRYSYSDRIRYYWPHPAIQAAVEKLFGNLAATEIPQPLLSQFLVSALDAERVDSKLPEDLVVNHIMNVCRTYAEACYGRG